MKIYVTMAVTHVWEYSKGSESELKGSVDELKGSVGELKGSVGDRDEGALCPVVLGEQRRALSVRARERSIGSGRRGGGVVSRGSFQESRSEGSQSEGAPEWEDPRELHQGWRTEGAIPREPVGEGRADGAALRGPRRWGLSKGVDPRWGRTKAGAPREPFRGILSERAATMGPR